MQAAFAAGAVLILGGWVDAKKIVGYIDWSLLLLIGSALGLSKGIVNSGLAGYVGRAIRDSGISPDASLFVLYAFTMVRTFTEGFYWLEILVCVPRPPPVFFCVPPSLFASMLLMV